MCSDTTKTVVIIIVDFELLAMVVELLSMIEAQCSPEAF